MKKRRFTRLLALLLAITMVFALPLEAGAAVKKVTANTNWKKAKAVKTGATTVTAKEVVGGNYSYVKFTATKTKTYKFTFSNLRKPGSSSSKDVISAHVYLQKKNKSGYPELVTAQWAMKNYKTKALSYVKNSGTMLCSAGALSSSTTLDGRSATASLKLKKGETVYINFGFSAKDGKTCLYGLNIK